MITGTNDKTNWEKRLAKIPVAPFYEAQPDYGWYRQRTDTSWRRVFFYYGSSTGRLCCLVDGKAVDETRAIELWVRVSEHPITKEVYDAVENGEPWPDDHPLIGVLHNRPPEEDTLEWLRDQLDPLVDDAKRLIAGGAAKTEEAAIHAAMIAGLIAELEKRVEAVRSRTRAPIWKIVADFDERWRPVVAAAAIHKALKQAVHTPWLLFQRSQKEAAEAAARKAAADAQRAAAEAQRRADDEAALAVATGDEADAAKATEVAAAAKAAAQEAALVTQAATEIAQRTVTVGSGRGRSVHLRGKKIAVIKDRMKALEFFQNHEKIVEELQKAANKAVQAGVEVPGTEVTEEFKAT